jgi:hypothetical protein
VHRGRAGDCDGGGELQLSRSPWRHGGTEKFRLER